MRRPFMSALHRRIRVLARVGVLAITASAAACSFAPESPALAPVDEVPAAFDRPGAPGERASLEWWHEFGDPVLDALVDSALTGNFDLAEAVARVGEARAAAGIALADLLPSVGLGADATRTSNPNNAGFGLQIGELLRALAGDTTSTGDGGEEDDAPEGPPARFTNEIYTASLSFAWELDFWGRARNDRAAAASDLVASQADLHAARLAVVSETITAYFDWSDLRRRVALNTQAVGVLRERTDLTQQRYDRGLAGSFELYQIRQELQSAEAALPQLRTQLADAERRLALVTGRHLQALGPILEGAGDPALPLDAIPAGVPSDLLAQRPDVWAAGLRLDAARRRVGARRAELLPGISLSAGVGLQSAEPATLLRIDQWFSNLVGGLTAPLFQGGRLRANLSAAESRFAQQAAIHARTVLTAVGESELALIRLDEERARWQLVDGQLAEAAASLRLQSERYAAGIAGYSDYLDALRNHLSVGAARSQAGRDLAIARLGVHRALGGSWVPAPDTSASASASSGNTP